MFNNFEFFSFVHPILVYLVVFFGLAVEGEIVLFSAGLLVYFGLLNYFLVLVAAFFGAWAGDMLWFLAGRSWGPQYFKKHRYWLFLSRKHFERLTEYFQTGHGERTVFFSKFSYGLNHAVIVAAGASQMNFKKFIRLDGWTSGAWVLIVLSLVQVLGHSFEHIRRLTKDIGLAVAVMVVIAVVIEGVLTKKVSKSL